MTGKKRIAALPSLPPLSLRDRTIAQAQRADTIELLLVEVLASRDQAVAERDRLAAELAEVRVERDRLREALRDIDQQLQLSSCGFCFRASGLIRKALGATEEQK